MGLGFDMIVVLARLKDGGHIDPPAWVAEIGAQQLAGSVLRHPEQLQDLCTRYGRPPIDLPPPTSARIAHGLLEHQPEDAPPAHILWRGLGYRHTAFDLDGALGSVPLDLNYESVPATHMGRYKLVTNCGTTEHIANQLNAFEVIHDLAAPGGVMLHMLPAQGMFCHGLFNYNLKFFWMLARSNDYQVLYQDYRADPASYSVPEDVLASVEAWDPAARERLLGYRASDCGLTVALKKTHAKRFVAPIDLPNEQFDRKARREWRERPETLVRRLVRSLATWTRRA